MDAEVIIVSGLPRSGTSLMMQMLDRGGVEVVTDNIRTADTDNPRGYFEFERVKKIKEDASWLPDARGKAVKMVSQLLFDLPPTERYRVVFMQREFAEMLTSQEKMLDRHEPRGGPARAIERAFGKHLEKLYAWLGEQPNFTVLYVKYAELVANPEHEARRISDFLGGRPDPAAMAAAVDPALYRNRKGEGS